MRWAKPVRMRQHMKCVVAVLAVYILLEEIPQPLVKRFPGRLQALQALQDILPSLAVDDLSAGAKRTYAAASEFLTEHSWDRNWPLKKQIKTWMRLWLGTAMPLWQDAMIVCTEWIDKSPAWQRIWDWMNRCSDDSLHEQYEEQEAEGCDLYLKLCDLLDR